jgi:uncharacterized protein (TIGR04255 family)
MPAGVSMILLGGTKQGRVGVAMTDRIHFEYPPLDEVVCGVQFAGVEWSGVHFGLFYTQLNGRYQRTQQRPPIPPSLFEPILQPAPSEVVLTYEPGALLLWYESADSPFLLQVQKDAFFVNWRHQSGAFIYPHFHTREGGEEGVWDRFRQEWQTFSFFCEQREIGTPEVLACHLAYINHMVRGETWEAPSDLARWFRPLVGLSGVESVSIFHMTVVYQVRGLAVRMQFRPAVRTTDKKELFVIELITNGKLTAENSLESWFDEAHTAIVQTFLAQITEEAHKRWGLSYG